MPKISIISLPIGNLRDISLRALDTLKEVKLIIAEEERNITTFLKKLSLPLPEIIIWNEHSSPEDLEGIFQTIQSKGSVAIVSDSGLPNLEDPGKTLIPYILDRIEWMDTSGKSHNHWKIEFLPGASSLDAGLALSGFSTRPFQFLGLLPRERKERIQQLKKYLSLGITTILLETPYRYKEVIRDIANVLGNNSQRRIFLGLNLTCNDEYIFRGSINNLLKILYSLPKALPVIVIEESKNNKPRKKS